MRVAVAAVGVVLSLFAAGDAGAWAKSDRLALEVGYVPPLTHGQQPAQWVQVANRSWTTPLSDVRLVVTLDPDHETFVSASPSQGTCSWSSPMLDCDLGTLPPDTGSVRPWVSVNLSTIIGDGDFVTHAATAYVAGVADVSDSATGTIYYQDAPPADIAVTAAGPSPVTQGDDYAVVATVTNNGPGAASGVSLQAAATNPLVSLSAGRGTCSRPLEGILCRLGTLAPGESTTVTIGQRAESTGGNRFWLTSGVPDPLGSNNEVPLETFVRAAPPPPATHLLRLDPPTHGDIIGPGGIYCGSAAGLCSLSVAGTADLRAVPDADYRFVSWGGDCAATAAADNCHLVMDADRRASATFAAVESTSTPRACVVPRVIGKTLAAAKRAIRARHCSVGPTRFRRSAKVTRGRVISQRPAAGSRRPSRTRVRLVASRGR